MRRDDASSPRAVSIAADEGERELADVQSTEVIVRGRHPVLLYITGIYHGTTRTSKTSGAFDTS